MCCRSQKDGDRTGRGRVVDGINGQERCSLWVSRRIHEHLSKRPTTGGLGLMRVPATRGLPLEKPDEGLGNPRLRHLFLAFPDSGKGISKAVRSRSTTHRIFKGKAM